MQREIGARNTPNETSHSHMNSHLYSLPLLLQRLHLPQDIKLNSLPLRSTRISTQLMTHQQGPKRERQKLSLKTYYIQHGPKSVFPYLKMGCLHGVFVSMLRRWQNPNIHSATNLQSPTTLVPCLPIAYKRNPILLRKNS